MKKDLIIFGNGKIADVVYYYAKNECDYNVVAFTTDREYIKEGSFNGLPVIPFDELEYTLKPDEHDMFVAIGYQDLNRLREFKYNESKAKGYKLVNVISPKSNLPVNVKTGDNCFIMPPSLVHPNVEIGSNTFVWSGAVIGHHCVIGEHCWFTSSCNISGVVKTGNNCFFAVNATVGHGVAIGNDCFIGANTLITKSIGDKKVVIQESSKEFRLNSDQFLRFSNFSHL